MADHAPSVPKLARVRPQSRVDQRQEVDREDLKVQLLLGSLAFGSIALSVLTFIHPFG
ncbi:MAG: hypothetical protein JWO11_682 [Nocardioides sp.]|nr:hypothetical protein [Nocardioides sp.]